MKALVGAFNQEKALVGAFSVIVKTDCETDGALNSTALPQGHNGLLRAVQVKARCPDAQCKANASVRRSELNLKVRCVLCGFWLIIYIFFIL